MAAPIQPVASNSAIPMAQDTQARTPARSAVLCGRTVTNCCAHTSFIAGYGVSFAGLAYSIWISSVVLGVLSGCVAVPIAVSHCFWSRYSNVANAAEDVDEAARGAREAATNVQIAATTILQTSGNIASAAGRTEKAAGHIQVVVDGERIDSLQASAAQCGETSQVMGRENALLKDQLEEIKGMLSPLMALVVSFRSSLSELKSGLKAGAPLLASFTGFEKRIERVALCLQGELETTSTSIQASIEEAAQLSIAIMQIIEQKNRELTSELRQATGSLQTAVIEVAKLSKDITEGSAAREVLIARIEAEQAENRALQGRLEETLKVITAQKRGYDEVASAGTGAASSPLGSSAEQIAMLTKLTVLMQECKISLEQQRAAGST